MATPEAGFVVLTRSVAGNQAWAECLTLQGFRVYCLPTIQTMPLPLDIVRHALKQIETFDWIVCTSATSVIYLQQKCMALGGVWPLTKPRFAAIGPRTAAAARAAGLTVAFQPTQANRIVLGGQLPVTHGARVLLPQTTIAGTELAQRLETRGARVTILPLYETRFVAGEDRESSQLLADGKVACLVFASASAVRGMTGRLSPGTLEMARRLPVIALGKEGAAALTAAGFEQIHHAAAPTAAGVVATLQHLLS